MSRYDFRQVDVFASGPLTGNPLAVVIGADDLDDAGMAAFARWTNLSETTFLLHPTVPEADYRVRIFTPHGELPFAGHPTLGTCHVWLETGHAPKGEAVVQQCEVGLIAVRRNEDTLAFAAPPILRGGAVDPALVERLRQAFGLSPDVIADSAWVDNGPGWVALLVSSHEALLAARPDYSMIGGYKVGLAALTDVDRTGASVEIRGFAPGYEDPATGSLNASVAQWLIAAGKLPSSYVARQGTALQRAARITVTQAPDGRIWVGGRTVTHVRGTMEF